MNPHPEFNDPDSGAPLRIENERVLGADGRQWPIVDGIARFVPPENYAAAFGEQWNRFPRTQLDSHTGLDNTRARLARCLRGRLDSLHGLRVLEAGSGAGRFTEILLAQGAPLDSFDFSAAVQANAANNGAHPALVLAQADIRRIPFPRTAYDGVVCLGVLQHTPDPEQSLRSLWAHVKPGGFLAIDHYRWKIRNFLPPPLGVAGIAWRRYFLGLPRERQYEAVKRVFDRWFPWVWKYRESRLAQLLLSRVTPIVNYYPHFGLRDRQMYYEWMLLDTHDAMTDVFKHRRTPASIRRTLQGLGAVDVQVSTGGNGVEAFCIKPMSGTR